MHALLRRLRSGREESDVYDDGRLLVKFSSREVSMHGTSFDAGHEETRSTAGGQVTGPSGSLHRRLLIGSGTGQPLRDIAHQAMDVTDIAARELPIPAGTETSTSLSRRPS